MIRRFTFKQVLNSWLGLETIGEQTDPLDTDSINDRAIRNAREVNEVQAFCQHLSSGNVDLAQQIANENDWDEGYAAELVQWWYFKS